MLISGAAQAHLPQLQLLRIGYHEADGDTLDGVQTAAKRVFCCAFYTWFDWAAPV
jgi:hypothetical protein